MATYYVDPGNTNVTTWVANTVYTSGDYVCPTDLATADAKSVYECTTGGTSHASTEPTWDEIVGNTTADGTVTWTARAPDSWDEALLSWQPAADLAVAGDIVYLRGQQNVTAQIDFDTNGGTAANGYIRYIGCNASGNVDGTQFVVDGGDNACHGGYINDKDALWFENITFQNCGNSTSYDGFSSQNTACYNVMFVNCRFNSNAGDGCYVDYPRAEFHHCSFNANGGVGVQTSGELGRFIGCEAIGNASHGIVVYHNTTLFGCVIHGNAYEGFKATTGVCAINCVFDSNRRGIEINSGWFTSSTTVIGCRITNHSTYQGINMVGTSRCNISHTYFGNNATNVTSDRYIVVPIGDGTVAHAVFGGTETDHGYVSPSTDDFNLDTTKAAATRSYAVTVP